MLTGLIIPASLTLSEVLATDTAQRLIDRGAQMYVMPDGNGLLSIKPPAGGIRMAVVARHLDPDTSPSEVTPCAA